MSDKRKYYDNLSGTAWFVGWLFTIGFLGLGFKDGFFAILLWPYQIGKAIAGF